MLLLVEEVSLLAKPVLMSRAERIGLDGYNNDLYPGLVGGWIVKQLLERGESPSAIRILDLRPPVRSDILAAHVDYVKTDITNPASVDAAFAKSWPGHITHRPLTIFHTAAMIGFAERAKDLMLPYYRINVLGTENVLTAAKEAGASCFISTSSGSAGMIAPTFFIKPWQPWPSHYVQVLGDATLPHHQGHDDFLMNYSVTKAAAELLVTNANNVKGEFLTGAIRPGHAIYGHGTENSSSLTYDYLTRQGGPRFVPLGQSFKFFTNRHFSWLHQIIASFVSAENVAISHLNYEHALLDPTASPSVSGRAFYVTDPNRPISYGDFYKGLETLPNTPVNFVPLPPVPMLLASHVIEFYALLRHRYLHFLPKLTGDIALLQPPLFNVGSTNIILSNEQAERSPAEGGIGYKGTVTTMEAMCKAVLEWNETHTK